MRIAVCDDEKRFTGEFRRITESIYNRLDYDVYEFWTATDLIESFKLKAFDIVFLDIEMPGTDGLELSKQLRKLSSEVIIVFLTSHVEYAIKGYEVNALRYLLKPITAEALKEIIDHVSSKIYDGKALWVRSEDREVKVKLDDIIYIEALNQYVLIRTSGEEIRVRGMISDYEEKLVNEDFFRIHRSYIVPLGKIVKTGNAEVVLEGDVIIPLSRGKKKELNVKMLDYMRRKAF